jgi:hypothetical protein
MCLLTDWPIRLSGERRCWPRLGKDNLTQKQSREVHLRQLLDQPEHPIRLQGRARDHLAAKQAKRTASVLEPDAKYKPRE